jgi:hypothetical protein
MPSKMSLSPLHLGEGSSRTTGSGGGPNCKRRRVQSCWLASKRHHGRSYFCPEGYITNQPQQNPPGSVLRNGLAMQPHPPLNHPHVEPPKRIGVTRGNGAGSRAYTSQWY